MLVNKTEGSALQRLSEQRTVKRNRSSERGAVVLARLGQLLFIAALAAASVAPVATGTSLSLAFGHGFAHAPLSST